MINLAELFAPTSFLERCLKEGRMLKHDLANGLGISSRTLSRWMAGGGGQLLPTHYEKLARAMYPRNPAFAAEVAQRAGTTVEALGLVPAPVSPPPVRATPPPAAPPAAVSPAAAAAQADAILCAVAERLDVSPRQLRPILAAAFARAHELGLTTAPVARPGAAGAPAQAPG